MKLGTLLVVVAMVTDCLGWRHSRMNDHKRRAGGRHRFRLSRLLDFARPYLEGEVRLGPHFNLNWDFLGHENTEPWWRGPNVCHSRQETEEEEKSDIQFHHLMGMMSCDQTDTSYKCTQSFVLDGKKRTIINKFECCYGFERLPGTTGCQKELNLKGLVETMQELQLNDIVRGIESVALTPLLQQGNYTIFAPIDGAFDIPDAEVLEDEAIDSNVIVLYPQTEDIVDQVRDILASHVVEGFFKSGDLEDEQVLESISPTGSTVRINKYEAPKKLTTANCVPVQSTDHLATSGVVHIVSGLLPPVKQTLYELIVSDPQFTTLKTVMAKTGLGRVLEEEGSLTLFAPTNSAFEKLGQERVERLLGNGECLKNVLKSHVLPHVICSSVIQGRARTRNILDVFLHVMRNDTDKLFVEQAQIVSRDVMASNGVMHVIDDVILPENALDIVEILEKNDYNAFLELLESAKMTKVIANTTDITILVPSQQAIESIPGDLYRELTSDIEKLQAVLKYHVITDGELDSCHLRHGRTLNTLGSDKTIAMREYSSFPFRRNNVLTAQCALVTRTTDIKSCNAIAHVIDKVLIPPVGDVLDVLQDNSDFSTFVALLKESGVAEDLQLSGPFTVFAPTNQYLEMLDITGLRYDRERLQAFLKNHIMREILCCAGVFTSRFGKSPLERMLGGKDMPIIRRGNQVFVDGNAIQSCDITATNGVVHALAGILDQEDAEEPSRFEFDIFDPWDDFNVRRTEDDFERPSRRLHHGNRHNEKTEEEDDWPWWMRRLAKSRRN